MSLIRAQYCMMIQILSSMFNWLLLFLIFYFHWSLSNPVDLMKKTALIWLQFFHCYVRCLINFWSSTAENDRYKRCRPYFDWRSIKLCNIMQSGVTNFFCDCHEIPYSKVKNFKREIFFLCFLGEWKSSGFCSLTYFY